MLWRKLWEQQHDPPCARGFMMAFSTLVLLSGCSCFLLEKDWFRRISPVNKIPMYMSLGISLCFAVSFTLVDLLNWCHDRGSSLRERSLVSTPEQTLAVLAGAVAMGSAFGLMFGALDVEDNVDRLRTEERWSVPIGLVLGGTVGAVNSVLAYRADMGLGEQIDLLRSEGLLDEEADGWGS